MRCRILHLIDIAIVLYQHTRRGNLRDPVPRIIALLSPLLLLYLLHDHAFTRATARSRGAIAPETARQVLHGVLQTHRLIGMLLVQQIIVMVLSVLARMLPNLTERLAEIFSATSRVRHNFTLVEKRRGRYLLVLAAHEIVILLSLAHENGLLGEAALMALGQHVRLHVD